MNITTLAIEIFNGTDTIRPIYEVHSWEDAERIIMNTKANIADLPNATFSFEVHGNSTAHIA